MASKVFIGAGAGFACDRTDAAGPVADTLASLPGARFLIFETLAERTLAQSQLDRRRDAARGYNPALERFVGPVLARCLRDGIKIFDERGWVQVLPDPDEPIVHLYAEGESTESSDELESEIADVVASVIEREEIGARS